MMKFQYICFLIVFFSANIVRSTTVIKIPTEELESSSDVIVQGVIRHVDKYFGSKQNLYPPKTLIEVEITRNIKGWDASEPILSMRLVGGYLKNGYYLKIPGMPQFKIGEEVILLLEKAHQGYIPIGLSQGVFYIDRQGDKSFVNRSLDDFFFVDDITKKVIYNDRVKPMKLSELLDLFTRSMKMRKE